MYEYRYVKIGIDVKEDAATKQLNDLGKAGWELVSFQPSSEPRGFANNADGSTTCFVFVFRKTKS